LLDDFKRWGTFFNSDEYVTVIMKVVLFSRATMAVLINAISTTNAQPSVKKDGDKVVLTLTQVMCSRNRECC
jgi:hypothetical protein